ncbi:MAG: glucose-1-phosphate thymidylyltransferase RfbA [Flavobacteriaceae bacterium]|nr:glucose-1-phosphate thymidylyltransferase RfbA [Flavobacteriaceae bacterium]
MKGILLAGGHGTRLYPVTKGTSKQLLAIYDKPMIYYPLSVLMQAGISEVLIISTPNDLGNFKHLFGDGSDLGMQFSYVEQPSPDGLAQAFILGEEFIGEEDVCLVLGDNIFHGEGLTDLIDNAVSNVKNHQKASVFGYYVSAPSRYGVAAFDANNTVISIEEKPSEPKSNYAVVGLYFYPNSVIKVAKSISPSERGELEITSVNQYYLAQGALQLEIMGRGYAWLDTGTHDSLLEASNFVQTIEKRQGLKIACIEEIAFEKGWIDAQQLLVIAAPMKSTSYGQYLLKLAAGK